MVLLTTRPPGRSQQTDDHESELIYNMIQLKVDGGPKKYT